MRDILLSCQGLTKRFGGLAAVHDVTLDWARDEIHAVIGPNGAGKSTLSHLLAGDLPCTSGRIQLTGQDVTHWHAEKRSHLGLGRSFQKTNIFLPLTVAENIRLAAQSRHQHGLPDAVDAAAPFRPGRGVEPARRDAGRDPHRGQGGVREMLRAPRPSRGAPTSLPPLRTASA